MKTLITTIFSFLFILFLGAQTSPLDPVCTFNYQAVARNADDNIIADQAITVVFTILDGPGANELYIEEHMTTTSSLGLFNLEVGAGDRIGGSLAWEAIPWVIRKHYLRVEVDFGDGNLINLGEAPLLAVPIAIQSKVASLALSVSDTIKSFDTLRVDSIIVKKLRVDSIIVQHIDAEDIWADNISTDSIVVEHIKADDIWADKIGTDELEFDIAKGDVLTIDSIRTDKITTLSVCVVDSFFVKDDDGNLVLKEFVVGGFGAGPKGSFAGVYGTYPFFGTHAGLFEGNVEIRQGDFAMTNGKGDTLFYVDTLGNSYHRGYETFAGGLEVVGLDGEPVFETGIFNEFLDGVGSTFQGGIILDDGPFEMYDKDGNLIFAIDKNGNSFHAGLEEFAGGLIVPDPLNPDINILEINPFADPFTDYAIRINGNMMVNGFFEAVAKNFVIDHPLDPENKTLRHYSIESDQMGTLYHGTIELDNNGEAWVELPEWFEALNKDFTYQLTCIGGFSNVYISEEIKNNRFKIAGGNMGMRVSWQVSGIRHDPHSVQYLKPIEAEKTIRK